MFMKCPFTGSVVLFADTAMHATLRSLGIAEKVISVINDIVNNAIKVQMFAFFISFCFCFYFITFLYFFYAEV